MPLQPRDDPDPTADEAFLARFARSEESSELTEWFSPIPEGYEKGRTK
ncbi:MAG: hypothetical protein ACYTFH_00260 [Planctomycetota bacterium]|jgi:hypothetical protein